MRRFLFAPFAVALLVLPTACSRGYRVEVSVDDLRVTLSAREYPLPRGGNSLTVELAEIKGGVVTNALVQVSYRLPNMPGMAPLEYRVDAVPSRSGTWTFAADTHTAAPWDMVITISRAGKAASHAKFTLEAR